MSTPSQHDWSGHVPAEPAVILGAERSEDWRAGYIAGQLAALSHFSQSAAARLSDLTTRSDALRGRMHD